MDRRLQAQEHQIAFLARRQHGVVARRQLIALGIDRHLIDNQLKAGRLSALHRGIYLVGPIEPAHARVMAAALACGEGSVVSHRSAAALWKLLPYPAQHGPVHVTVQVRRVGRHQGIRIHHVCALGPGEATRLHRIPITTPARTILDIAATVRGRELEQAVALADREHLAGRAKLLSLLARYPRRPGTPALRALLERRERPALTRSEAEERLLELIRRADLPAPEVNVQLERFEVDFLWRAEGLVVEVDGFAFHGGRAEFEADRQRDAHLTARGFRVMRVTWRQIVDEPEATVVRIAQALASPRGG